MSSTLTTMRLDESDKEEAKVILNRLGLNISSATNLFLKAVIRENGLPFKLKLDKPKINYTDTYLAPLMSNRNKINKSNSSINRTKKIINVYKKDSNLNRKKMVL